MQTKSIQLASGQWIHVPVGLSAQQEAHLIASLDPVALEVEANEIWRQHEAGELLPFETVLADLFNHATDIGPTP